MSGHSKWATIHRDKEINDQKRGQMFTKIANAVTLAVKETGGITDPNSNFKLRLAIEKARAVNMPNEKIKKAVDRGLGKGAATELSETTFEGYTSGGVGVLVETLSDNHQRTVQEVKNLFDKSGGSIASPGSVAFNFKKTGLIEIENVAEKKDELLLQLIDLGVEDVDEDSPDLLTVYVPVDRFDEVKTKISSLGLVIKNSEIVQRPISLIEISDKKMAEQLVAFLDKLDCLDDVQRVYANATFP